MAECQDLRSEIERWKNLITEERDYNEEENEEFKIKVAHLRGADLRSLQTYYQN